MRRNGTGALSRNAKTPEPVGPWGWADITVPTNIGIREQLKVYRVVGFSECTYKSGKRYCKCKKNPYCLWGMGDLMWKSDDDVGVEAEQSQNRDQGQIVGLQNLGNTCYVNSLLQLWYHNPIVRPAILRWKPPAHTVEGNKEYTPECAVGHLQAMFARMKSSKQRTIDTKPLVAALQLDAALQQDAQEFAKLLLEFIANELELSDENVDISRIFKTCFTGESHFQTTCENCGTITLGRKEEFKELTLNIFSTLHDSLQDYFKEERLEDDNRYFCNICGSKQNAIRKSKLLKLPQVLNIQLMRFLFDAATLDKKKVMKTISFPEILDMTDYQNPEMSNGDQEYDQNIPKERQIYRLNAVLIHNGRKVSSGHYISHIKDLVSGGWFECNDDRVEKIDKKGYSENLVMKSEEGEGGDEQQQQQQPQPANNNPKNLNPSSKGAYMLVYTKQEYFTGGQPDPEIQDYLLDMITKEDTLIEAEFEGKKRAKVLELEKRAQRQLEIDLLFKPKYAQAQEESTIQKENDVKSDGIRNGNSKDEKFAKNLEIESLKSQLMGTDIRQPVLHLTPPAVKLCEIDFISAEWLENWLQWQVVDLPPIHNNNITCRHNRLKPPRKNETNVSYKIIPSSVADVLYQNYDGLRLSHAEAFCKECVKSHCELIQAHAKLELDAKTVAEDVKNCDNELARIGLSSRFHQNKFLIGKESFREWKRHAKGIIAEKDRDEDIEVVDQEEWNLNQELRCVHGNLNILKGTHKRITVERMFLLGEYFPNAIWYGSGQPECEECSRQATLEYNYVEQYKQFAMKEKTRLNDLVRGVSRPSLYKPGEYYMIPTEFFNTWMSFIKDARLYEQLHHIPTAQLLCQQGDCDCLIPGLKFPAEFVKTGNDEVEEVDFHSVVTFVRPDELEILTESRSIDTKISINISMDPNNHGKMIYKYNLGVCEKSAFEWKEALVAHKYIYVDGEIFVRRVEEDEIQDSILEYDDDFLPPKMRRGDDDTNGPVRRSERRRQSRDDKKYRHIPSSMVLLEFQNTFLTKDFKAFCSDQHLYWNKKELSDIEKHMTFGQLRIPEGATLFIKIDKPKDIDEAMDVEETTESTTVERGFSGTALLQSNFIARPTASPTTNGLS